LYHQIGINYFYYVTYCSCLIRGSYWKSWAMSHGWQLCNIKRLSMIW
jgi:hypothetical protein